MIGGATRALSALAVWSALACSSSHGAVSGAPGLVGNAGDGERKGARPAVEVAQDDRLGGAQPSTVCPPTATPCKVLPLGDSITNGTGFAGGYRVELFRQAIQNGASIIFVGSQQNGPETVDGVPFPKRHEGHDGWTIEELGGLVPTPALSEAPAIILLHAGTNDMHEAPEGAAERLGVFIDALIARAPEALVAVAKIIPASVSWGDRVMAYNAGVGAVVRARARQGKNVLLVDQFSGFPEDELADGVHPNEAGYVRMGQAWYAALADYLH